MYINIETQEYPVYLNDIRNKYPNKSIPDSISEETLEELGYSEIYVQPEPEYNYKLQTIRRLPPEFLDGKFQIKFEVVNKSQEQVYEELSREYVNLIQSRLDSFAQTRNYDTIFTARTYINSSIENFKNEAIRASELQDTTWSKCYEILDLVKSGKMEIPTEDELISLLPTLSWD